MVSSKAYDTIVQPFESLRVRFDLELALARENLVEWSKARSIDASGQAIVDHDLLREKIHALESGRDELDVFIGHLRARMQSTTAGSEGTLEDIRSSLDLFTRKLTQSQTLLNYGYSVTSKNEINRRITAVNSSGRLNNQDMAVLQNRWMTVRSMKNDRRLLEAKIEFESYLKEWETLIASMSKGSRGGH